MYLTAYLPNLVNPFDIYIGSVEFGKPKQFLLFHVKEISLKQRQKHGDRSKGTGLLLLMEEPLEPLIYYGEIYLKYIELTNSDIKEEDIKEQIKKLDGKGAITK